MTQKNFKKYFMIYFIGFGIFIGIIGAFTNYLLQIKDMKIDRDKKAQEIFQIKIDTILKPSISNMENTIKALSTNKTILEFLDTNKYHSIEELEQIFFTVAGSQSAISQIRLLSKDGQEMIRVNSGKTEETTFLVPKDKLQNKSNRDYFQFVSMMKQQEIWYSKIDLNIENGKIEIPYVPTFRVAMPLFKDSVFNGMLIVNMNLDEIFNSIGKSTIFEHYIIDKNNNFILHPDNQFSLNKYKNIKRDIKIDFPQGLNQEGIYTFPIENILNNGDDAIFILKIKDNYEKQLLNNKLETLLVIFVVTILLSVIIAIVISKNPIKLQVALLKAHDRLNEFASIIDKYVITSKTKSDTTIIDVSSAFVATSGYTKDELIGKKINIIKHPEEDKNKHLDLWNTIQNGQIWDGEIKNIAKNGQAYWLEQHIIPKIDNDTHEDVFVSIGVDITAKKELEKVASIDKLTGLYNRRMIDEFLKKELESQRRHFSQLSMIMIDIDYFKSVNDTYGHLIGDKVLIQLAKILVENSRKSDIQGRFGGEEFIIICPQTTSESALILAEKLRKAVENFHFEEVGNKTISLGISSYENVDTMETLIKKADEALYKAKNSGRNKIVVYEKEIGN